MDEAWLYNIMIGFSFVVGIAVYVTPNYLKVRSLKKLALSLAGVSICLILAIICSNLLALLLYESLYYEYLQFFHEYYISLAFFYLFCILLKSLFVKIKIETNLACWSLVVFSLLSRIGCLMAGCCKGKSIAGFELPIVPLEISFAIIFIVVMCFSQKKDYLTIYVFCYSAFRLATEFLRQNYGVRTYGGINCRQILAIVIILFVITDHLYQKLSYKGGKTA